MAQISQRRSAMKQRTACAVTAIVVATVVGAAESAPIAAAQPAGTLCGNVQNQAGVSEPVIVLKGDVDCSTAVNVANGYLYGPHPTDGGTLQLTNVNGWQCLIPLVAGRSHADSYLECDQGGNGFKIGN
jgi:hypothetical protein